MGTGVVCATIRTFGMVGMTIGAEAIVSLDKLHPAKPKHKITIVHIFIMPSMITPHAQNEYCAFGTRLA
jgi:hypothetical protein